MVTYFVLLSTLSTVSYVLFTLIKLLGGKNFIFILFSLSIIFVFLFKLTQKYGYRDIKQAGDIIEIRDTVNVSVNRHPAKTTREAPSDSIKRDIQFDIESMEQALRAVNSKKEEISLNIYGGSIFGHVGAMIGPSISDMADLNDANMEIYEIRNTLDSLKKKLSLVERFDPDSNIKNFFSLGAEIAHSAPKELLYNESTDIEFVLVPEGAGVSANSLMTYNNDGEYFSKSDIEYSKRMQVTLEGKSFDITPAGPQIRRMIDNMPMEWHWNIIPIEYGNDKQLSFRLDAVHYSGDNYEVVATETYKAIVFVDVGWFDWIDKKVEKIGNLGSAVGGLIMLLIGIFGFYFEHLRKKSSKFT